VAKPKKRNPDGRRGKAQETQPSEMGRRKLGLIRRIRARGPGRAGLRALPTITGAIQSGLELIRPEVDSRCSDRPGFGRGFLFGCMSCQVLCPNSPSVNGSQLWLLRSL
jgi:hypothetical protein